MGTCDQSTTVMDTEDDVTPAPTQLHNDGNAVVCFVSVRSLRDNWQKWSDERREYQERNPFSQDTRPTAALPRRGLEQYGRPAHGSKAEQRGKDAHAHMGREVRELCEVIRNIGTHRDKDGEEGCSGGKVITVEFGKLFEHYVTISNKLVGVLLRARKQRLVDFEGGMLWQGQDDRVVITLLQ